MITLCIDREEERYCFYQHLDDDKTRMRFASVNRRFPQYRFIRYEDISAIEHISEELRSEIIIDNDLSGFNYDDDLINTIDDIRDE